MVITKLEKFINNNLPRILKEESKKTLGDRKKYIGSSDIGSCLRKAYLDKVRETEYDMATLIRLERGHISEGIVRKMLTGLKVKEQVEVRGMVHGFSLKSHIDFMLENKEECVIVEAKSVSSAIAEPYSSWLAQVQYQLHLLKINRNKPVRAYIVAIELNSGWYKTFTIDYNETLAKMALKRAAMLIDGLKKNKEPEAEEQLYCSMCPHKGDCPVLNEGAEELKGDALQLAQNIIELEKKKKEIEKTLKAKKAELEEIMKEKRIKKIKIGDNFISATNESIYRSIDTQKIKKQNEALYEELLEKYGKETKRKSYLVIK